MITASQLLTQGAATKDGVLVDAPWLAEHLSDPTVRVVEVDVNRAAYDQWHIDGAVLWNLYQDLKDANYRPVDSLTLARLIGRSGIAPDTTVVFYGYAPAMGFWLMKLLGHADVRILDCSRDAWRSCGHSVSTSPTVRAPVEYPSGEPNGDLRAGHPEVAEAIGAPGVVILDVRSDAEYRGERFWPSGGLDPIGRAGHVPSAVHQPLDGILDQKGSFRSAPALRRLLSSIDLDGDGKLITYCTIGGRACTAWFVLSQLLGREGVRVYDGSWAEWGRLPETPVDRA